MLWRKLSCSIGVTIAWLAAGELWGQMPQLRIPSPTYLPFCEQGSQPAWPDFRATSPQPATLCQPSRFAEYQDIFSKDMPTIDPMAGNKPPRIILFRVPAGFLANPLDLDPDDDLGDGDTPPASSAGDDDLNFLQVNLGRQIPYLDMFRKGDPGGLGYYKLHSQLQVFDSGSSSLCLALQAVTPAMDPKGELYNGPTTIIPAVSCFQEIYAGTAVHAYIGEPVLAGPRWHDNLFSSFRYSLAVQQPILVAPSGADQGLFLFVQTLGQYHTDTTTTTTAPALEIIPGLQWRVNHGCWMSLGISRYNFLSCSWQF